MQTTPKEMVQQNEQPARQGWLQKTLKFAGLGYILGDAAMFGAAAARKNAHYNGGQMFAAGSWLAGGAAAAYYGDPSPEKQLAIQGGKLEAFFEQKGIAIAAAAREHSPLLKHNGLGAKFDRFMHEHPSQALNAGYLLGAVTTFADGMREHRDAGKNLLPKSLGKQGLSNVSTSLWIGVLVTLGALGGLFIKEDPDAKEKAKSGNAVDKVAAWFQEKPLRFSAIAYGLNNIPLAAKAWGDFSNRAQYGAVKPHYFSMAQLGLYVVSNLLLFATPRNQINHTFDAASMAKLEDAAAQVIATQPPEQQAALLSETSQFLAKQKGITRHAGDIANNLAARITELTGERLQQAASTTRWVERAHAQGESPQLAR